MSKGNMEIRKSTREDIKQIMAIFTTAKEYMAAHGNKPYFTSREKQNTKTF